MGALQSCLHSTFPSLVDRYNQRILDKTERRCKEEENASAVRIEALKADIAILNRNFLKGMGTPKAENREFNTHDVIYCRDIKRMIKMQQQLLTRERAKLRNVQGMRNLKDITAEAANSHTSVNLNKMATDLKKVKSKPQETFKLDMQTADAIDHIRTIHTVENDGITAIDEALSSPDMDEEMPMEDDMDIIERQFREVEQKGIEHLLLEMPEIPFSPPPPKRSPSTTKTKKHQKQTYEQVGSFELGLEDIKDETDARLQL